MEVVRLAPLATFRRVFRGIHLSPDTLQKKRYVARSRRGPGFSELWVTLIFGGHFLCVVHYDNIKRSLTFHKPQPELLLHSVK
jgi:hypothetical protein